MTRSAVKKLSEFTFQSDFTPPRPAPETGPDTVSVSASELAELLANARNEGMAAADARHDQETAKRLEAMSEQLRAAMGELLKLAECLDQASLSEEAEHTARTLISTACTHIVNGQGDLFVDQ